MLDVVVCFERHDTFLGKNSIGTYGSTVFVENIVIVTHFAHLRMMIERENLFFKKRNIFIWNTCVNDHLVTLITESDLKREIIFGGIVLPFRDRMHAGIELLHRTNEFLKTF